MLVVGLVEEVRIGYGGCGGIEVVVALSWDVGG